MSLDDFLLISRFFHVSDSSKVKPRGDPNFDPWHKIRPFLDSCNELFKRHYKPKETVSIDESMIGMRNRFGYIQYMPNKRHSRYGIKKFELFEADVGYVFHTDLYSGRDFYASGSEKGLSHTVVMSILEKSRLLNKGYHLVTDNFYTKVPLAEALLENKTSLTGTIRINSKGLPQILKKEKMKVGEPLYVRKGQLLTCGVKGKATRKPVYLLSSYAHAENITLQKRHGEVVKPKVINDYNIGMGGVISVTKSYTSMLRKRPSRRYWKKIFTHLLDIAVLNAYIMYQQNTDKPVKRSEFLRLIVACLCCNEERFYPLIPASPSTSRSLSGATSPASGGSHQSSLSPGRCTVSVLGPEHKYARLDGTKLRLCAVCPKHSKHWCPGCNVGIHEGCWHQLEHYFRAKGRPKRKSEDE
ncbi:piggyBac transposable element-derived protein 4-like [Macrobrachium rosenbergii]|uniref:piggyBac transposable element-derived protein 4-like n=1 Tax=Macrobrachium rosenbergii TaxID=79674 RepID=UPI0034D4FBC9